MKVLVEYTIHRKEIIEIPDYEFSNKKLKQIKDDVMDIHVSDHNAFEVLDWKIDEYTVEMFEVLE